MAQINTAKGNFFQTIIEKTLNFIKDGLWFSAAAWPTSQGYDAISTFMAATVLNFDHCPGPKVVGDVKGRKTWFTQGWMRMASP